MVSVKCFASVIVSHLFFKRQMFPVWSYVLCSYCVASLNIV